MHHHQIKQTLFTIMAVLVTALSLTACHYENGGNYNGGYNGGGGYNDPYKRAWYDVYGTRCIGYGYPMAGCNFYSNGDKIIASEDPYYFNLSMESDYWSYTDSYGYYREYRGFAWLSPTGILYDDYGNALNEMDIEEAQSADVIGQAAKKEKEMAKLVGKAFSKKYALDEQAGISIAKTLQDWAVLGRDRVRNETDVADVSKRLYGVKLEDAKTAMIEASKGDRGALENINIDVAAHWGTTPETSKEILTNWYKEELSDVGL